MKGNRAVNQLPDTLGNSPKLRRDVWRQRACPLDLECDLWSRGHAEPTLAGDPDQPGLPRVEPDITGRLGDCTQAATGNLGRDQVSRCDQNMLAAPLGDLEEQLRCRTNSVFDDLLVQEGGDAHQQPALARHEAGPEPDCVELIHLRWIGIEQKFGHTYNCAHFIRANVDIIAGLEDGNDRLRGRLICPHPGGHTSRHPLWVH